MQQLHMEDKDDRFEGALNNELVCVNHFQSSNSQVFTSRRHAGCSVGSTLCRRIVVVMIVTPRAADPGSRGGDGLVPAKLVPAWFIRKYRPGLFPEFLTAAHVTSTD